MVGSVKVFYKEWDYRLDALLADAEKKLVKKAGTSYDEPAETVKKDVISGAAILAVVFSDGSAIGAIKFMVGGVAKEGFLHMSFGYADRLAGTLCKIGMDTADSIAKTLGLPSIEFSSKRKGWKVVAPKYGYKIVSEDGGIFTYRKRVRK